MQGKKRAKYDDEDDDFVKPNTVTGRIGNRSTVFEVA
jgi:hypothetical protein